MSLSFLFSPLGIIVICFAALCIAAHIITSRSLHNIGENEIGLVIKRVAVKKLEGDNPIAFNGEAGYQAELLMPGLRFMLWPVYAVEKHPWVQVPAGQIGVVIAQVGSELPIGAKSAQYKREFGDFRNVNTFINNGGQKGIQRPVLSPGSTIPIHPVAFLVVTADNVYGVPISEELRAGTSRDGHLSPDAFGIEPARFRLTVIEPQKDGNPGEVTDVIGIVTVFEGNPLPSGDIAGRLGGFDDMETLEREEKSDAQLIEVLLGNKNDLHNNYQDFQAFLDNGGRIGLQYDVLMYGAYALNPFLVKVETVPMTVVQQGQVAVVKSYVGQATKDTSGENFKFGSLVRPGHRGIWQEPLRTGKFPINPRCYKVEIVPTSILTLNWAAATSAAHNLDSKLSQIEAKSKEGFVFKIDLQVQIHVPDTKAPKIISMVGTMQNLVNEVLQAAVGNHMRDKLQTLAAVDFISTRQEVQRQASEHVTMHLGKYEVETRGVYIQDVVFPAELVKVLQDREIAAQQIETYKQEKLAEDERVARESSGARADKQKELIGSEIGIKVNENNARARTAQADGEAYYIRETGRAKAAEVEATGLAQAKGYEEQVKAMGRDGTALINVIRTLAENQISIVPQVQAGGASGGGGAIEGLAAVLTGFFANKIKGDQAESGGES